MERILILASTAGNEGPGRHVMDTLEGRCVLVVNAVAMKQEEKKITLEAWKLTLWADLEQAESNG